MPEYLFEYFDETEPEFIEVDTSTLPVPAWEPPPSDILTLDDLEDLDDELEAYDYTREPRPRDRYHEKSSITLRDYQEQAVNNTFDEWLKGNWSTLVVMATATGKTFVMAGIAKRYQGVFGPRPDGKPRRGLFLAHRDYLLGQLANAMAAMGLESAIEQAEKKAMAGLFDDPEIVIASVQSMQRKRLEHWPRNYFDYIVTDEGHHGPAKSYQNIYRYFRPYAAHRLFLTATPKRSDDETLEDLCHSRAFIFDIPDAVKRQPPCICTKVRVAYCDTKVDISNIRTTKMDLNTHDISEALKPYIEPIVRAFKKEVGDRTFIAYWPDVKCSEAVTSAMISLGLKVTHLDANSKDQVQVLDGFRNGLYQGLNNCAKFGEGFDLPDVSAIGLGRPVSEKAEGLYKQMVGRGLRLKTGKHKDLLLIDFPWVAGKHSLMRPADIFATNGVLDEVYEEVARKTQEDGGTDDLMAAITRADEVVKERERIKLIIKDGRVKYSRTEFEVLGGNASIPDQPQRQERDGGFRKRLTDKQIALLEKNGVEGIESMSLGRASYHIREIIRRIEEKKATYKQIKEMVRLGVEPKVARSVGIDEASAIISKLGRRR